MTHLDFVHASEYVDMVDDESSEAADAGCMADHRHVEPANPSRTAGDGSVLTALVPDLGCEFGLLGTTTVFWGLTLDRAELRGELAGSNA